MKTAVVILTCNAGKNFETVLRSHAGQTLKADLRLMIDSESDDATVETAQKYDWEIRICSRAAFNHGRTRQKAVEELLAKGFECVIMATQDVVLAAPDTLETLVGSLRQNDAAGAYARQLPPENEEMDSFFRRRNYPERSRIKTKNDIPELGLMTAFCSDSLAAWDLQKISAAGGFPETDFGEDMLLGAALILRGEKILYCAESCCFHGHPDRLPELFRRGAGIGRMHALHPELHRQFGSVGSFALKQLSAGKIFRYFIPLSVKYLGILYGRLKTKKRL